LEGCEGKKGRKGAHVETKQTNKQTNKQTKKKTPRVSENQDHQKQKVQKKKA
jgi:hypothetical protein